MRETRDKLQFLAEEVIQIVIGDRKFQKIM